VCIVVDWLFAVHSAVCFLIRHSMHV